MILIITIAATAATLNMAAAQESNLFSSVNPKSAFTASPDSATSKNIASTVTSGDQLREMLKLAGFEAKTVGSLAASTTKEIDPWTIPVLVTLSEDEQWIQVVLGLTVIKDSGTQLTTEKLLDLMKVGQRQNSVSLRRSSRC